MPEHLKYYTPDILLSTEINNDISKGRAVTMATAITVSCIYILV